MSYVKWYSKQCLHQHREGPPCSSASYVPPLYFLRARGRCHSWRRCSSSCWLPPCCGPPPALPALRMATSQTSRLSTTFGATPGRRTTGSPTSCAGCRCCTPSARWRTCPPPRPGTTPVSIGRPAGTRSLTSWPPWRPRTIMCRTSRWSMTSGATQERRTTGLPTSCAGCGC